MCKDAMVRDIREYGRNRAMPAGSEHEADGVLLPGSTVNLGHPL